MGIQDKSNYIVNTGIIEQVLSEKKTTWETYYPGNDCKPNLTAKFKGVDS